ncbi:2'-5' RNA ligase family protein [Parasphingorhabdus pacifica]
MTDIPHADQVRNHTRWRTGWYSGRRSYAWLLTLGAENGLRQLANQYQYALVDLPGFDLMPLEWMHIVVQEVGFADELSDEQVERTVATTRERLAEIPAPSLAFHRAIVLPESLALPAEPQSTLLELRASVREAIGQALGGAEVPAEPEDVDQHVSLAHSTTEGPAVFAVATLGATIVDPVTVKVPEMSLVRLNRDHSCSEWETVARVPFGG